MKRLKITLPNEFAFSCLIPIRITDLNYGNHLSNDKFLQIIHEARVQYLAFYGYSEFNIEGIGLVLVDAELEFKKEVFYPTTLKIWVQATHFNKIGFDIFYKAEIFEKDAWHLVLKAKTSILGFNYELRQKQEISSHFVNKLSQQSSN